MWDWELQQEMNLAKVLCNGKLKDIYMVGNYIYPCMGKYRLIHKSGICKAHISQEV